MSVEVTRSTRLATCVAALIVALSACAQFATPAAAAKSKHAAMVMDANTGRILYSDAGDALRHPASLTKMMTIYMAFDLLKQGRLNADTLITISKTAAAQPPSKFGLKPGRKIKLIHAIKALVTKSANDIAVAIAEHIGGTEYNFATMMTRKARSLGMTRTVFKNASGLPHSAQVTTARDMLKLALALQDDFPRLYPLFKTRYFTYGGKTYKNHNTLLGRVSGVDGIKTGYIRASGFNLVTSMRKNGRHLVAAVFGGKTGRRRNARMRGLLKRHIRRASKKRTRRTRPLLIAARKRATPRPIQVRRPAPRPARAAMPTPTIKMASVHRVAVVPRAQARPAPRTTRANPARPAGRVRGRPPSTLQDQLADLLANNRPANSWRNPDRNRTPQPAPNQPAAATATSYQIQIGAYKTPAEAERRLTSVAQRTQGLLSGYIPVTQSVDRGQRTLYRARFKGFKAAAARSTCRQLKKQAIDCLVAR